MDLKFGLFVHFGMGTYQGEDWADPDKPISDFNPARLDCRQWVDAAQAANMAFGCMSVKHHCGFCMWNTATTDYNACKSAAGRDVVKEFTDALRERLAYEINVVKTMGYTNYYLIVYDFRSR